MNSGLLSEKTENLGQLNKTDSATHVLLAKSCEKGLILKCTVLPLTLAALQVPEQGAEHALRARNINVN